MAREKTLLDGDAVRARLIRDPALAEYLDVLFVEVRFRPGAEPFRDACVKLGLNPWGVRSHLSIRRSILASGREWPTPEMIADAEGG